MTTNKLFVKKGIKTCLKVIEEGDLDKIFTWKNDYELSILINAHPIPVARYELNDWFKKIQSDKNQLMFGIYNLESKETVGVVRLMFIDWISGTAELGIFIGEKSSRGKGIGREALNLILAYAFYDLNLSRIYLKVSEKNTNAIHLYESCNFIKEGLLRKHFWSDNKHENAIVMGILRNEFK